MGSSSSSSSHMFIVDLEWLFQGWIVLCDLEHLVLHEGLFHNITMEAGSQRFSWCTWLPNFAPPIKTRKKLPLDAWIACGQWSRECWFLVTAAAKASSGRLIIGQEGRRAKWKNISCTQSSSVIAGRWYARTRILNLLSGTCIYIHCLSIRGRYEERRWRLVENAGEPGNVSHQRAGWRHFTYHTFQGVALL